MAAVLKLPDVRERIVLLRIDPRRSTPASLAEFDEGETKRWQPTVAGRGATGGTIAQIHLGPHYFEI
jgi:hypothetical protein